MPICRPLLTLTFLSFIPLLPVAAGDQPLTFNRHIRPILSDNCFSCHGPDEAQRKGKLRLDTLEGALKGGENGPAFIVGKPAESALIKRIHTADADDAMPPEKFGKTLTPEQKEILAKWIQQGASYEGHWAFQAVVRPVVPHEQAPHPVDAFLLTKLKKEGLAPQPEAPKETLIRRVALDLTGLPPTLAEIDAFLADASPDAYEKMVERYLSSPHYGEKMALPWLDMARYADSNGFQTDSSRQMWPWRDWLIGAFNANKPFDQFTIEQIAGDMLPEATQDQILATGFNRNTRLNGEGGRIAEEWFTETVIDRVETTGSTWMALTMNCCRCHDHKYDPISQKEFYGLYAYFNSVDESGVLDSEGGNRGGGNSKPMLAIASAAQETQRTDLNAKIKQAETQLAAVKASAAERQVIWETEFLASLAKSTPAWQPVAPSQFTSKGGATLTKQPDGSILAAGKNPAHDTYVIESPLPAGVFSGLLLETLPDASLPNQSLGRAHNGNYVLSDVDAEIIAPGVKEPVTVNFAKAAADYEQSGWEVKNIVADKPKRKKGAKNKTGWAISGNEPEKRLPRKAMFVAATPVSVPDQATLRVYLRHDALEAHNIGRFRLSASSQTPALLKLDGTGAPESLKVALDTAQDKRSAAQKKEISKFFTENADAVARDAQSAVSAAKAALDALEDTIPTTMVMKERAQPRDAFLLDRGEYDRPKEKVARVLPKALPGLAEGLSNDRLGLAKWLVSGTHPLTARVWVNRTWEKFFGTGIVKTTENFGSQADWPSHPELLDWMAAEFVQPTVIKTVGGKPAQPWDMKAFQKMLVTSAAYRQSSKVTPKMLEMDPENRLISRGPRFRLSGEVLRDQALAVSSLLVPQIGGKSVRPYMPVKVWDETSVYGDMRGYKEDAGDGLYRRSMYTIWKRTAAPPSMLIFDAPTREICTVKRGRTNTPLQALSLLNEKTFVEAARVLAEAMMQQGGITAEQRIAWGFRRVTGRLPHPAELAPLRQGLEKRLERFKTDPKSATEILTVGARQANPALPAQELAAYAVTANVLLNLDEVVTRE